MEAGNRIKAEANDGVLEQEVSFSYTTVILSSYNKSLQVYNSLLFLYVSMVYVQMKGRGHPDPLPFASGL